MMPYLKSTPSTSRPEGLRSPFDKFKALSAAEELRVDPELNFFTPP